MKNRVFLIFPTANVYLIRCDSLFLPELHTGSGPILRFKGSLILAVSNIHG